MKTLLFLITVLLFSCEKQDKFYHVSYEVRGTCPDKIVTFDGEDNSTMANIGTEGCDFYPVVMSSGEKAKAWITNIDTGYTIIRILVDDQIVTEDTAFKKDLIYQFQYELKE